MRTTVLRSSLLRSSFFTLRSSFFTPRSSLLIPRSSFLVLRSSFLFLCLTVGWAAAQPEPWFHPDGSVHYYHAISTPDGIDWNFAWDSALGHGGYLATVTSPAENDFVFGLVDSGVYWYERPGTGLLAGPWLGGTQDFGSHEPDSGWHWVTNEAMGFRKWSPGEPDNQGGNENALHFGESTGVRVPTWNDLSSLDGSIRGFVRELSADSQTLGLFRNDSSAFVGYTLFTPLSYKFTYLIDNKGRLVRTWHSSYPPGASCYLLEDGSLLRSARLGNSSFPGGGTGGRVERYDWDGSLQWSYQYSSTLHCQHHDIASLPNGNVLLVAWELKTRAEAVAAGRNPSWLVQNKLWPDHVVEVNPATDSIVWEWHVWDHLIQDYDSTKANYGDPAQHSELADINFTGPPPLRGAPDWLHVNSVAYNPDFDQVILSIHNLNEVWVIDHSTTTEEARGHTGGRFGMGGDLLYRWGNPRAYRAGDTTDRKLFGQHNAQWIGPGLPGAGHILLFNNGIDGRGYSSVDEFIPPCDSAGNYPRPAPGTPFGPAAQCWVYVATPPASLFSATMGGAQRFPNGNTLICESDLGAFFEVTRDSQIVWHYLSPATDSTRLYQGDTVPGGASGKQNNTFRALRYPPDYPGLSGRNLTPGYPLELYQTRQFVGLAEPSHVPSDPRAALSTSPNPFRTSLLIHLTTGPLDHSTTSVHIFDAQGRLCRQLRISNPKSEIALDFRGQHAGVYLIRVQTAARTATARVVFTP